jgi:hypothetical protein
VRYEPFEQLPFPHVVISTTFAIARLLSFC